MYERIQYSTEEIREVIQTLRRIYDNAEKNLKEWTQIKALLQECSFSKENKEILQQHNLSGTGTTARMIADYVGLKIKVVHGTDG